MTQSFAIIICLAAAVFLPNGANADTLKASKPNIVLVMTDDQGMGDLSCMGNKVVRTPNIDQFYEKSLRLADFQVSPTCAPTRAAMMSGVAPFKAGVTHTILQRERMAPRIFTLPQALQSGGYSTGLSAKMPEKTEETKRILLKIWEDIEAEGPEEWWLNERQKPMKGATLNY